MSKYNIDDVVLSKFGFDGNLEKFKVTNVRCVDEYKLNDIISFRYEWNNKEKIYEDPYVYDLELYCNKNLTCDDGKCKSGESREMCEKVPYFCPPNTINSK